MRFLKIAADGTQLPEGSDVTDHVAVLLPDHGLMFSVSKPIEGETTHHKALEACASYSLLGFTDWRLPERLELLQIVDHSKTYPAINEDAFPGTEQDWYWSATLYAGSPSDCAWYVSFGYGGSGYGNRGHHYGFVRAVRSVPPSQ